jgi:hypothetical protein
MHLRIFKAAVATCLTTAALTAVAHAGEYHVYSCRTPAGEAAPVDGWSGSVTAGAQGGTIDQYALDTCADGGALISALGDTTLHPAEVDKAAWAFSAPAATTLVAAKLWRAEYLHGQAGEHDTYESWMTGPNENLYFDVCVFTAPCTQQGDLTSPLATGNVVVVPSSSLGQRVTVNVNCGPVEGEQCQPSAPDPNGYAAAVYVYAADLTLQQNAGPTASGVGGDLAGAPAVQGLSDVTFAASDPGSGVYEALFSVDGQVVQRTVLDANGGRCRDVGQTGDGLPAFLYVQPCLASLSADVPFDTRVVGNGAHQLVVSVIDAAGNSAPVLDRAITVANPPPAAQPGPANGVNASTQAILSVRWQGTRRATLLSSFGRAQTLTGRLTTAQGTPISGAQIDLSATPSYSSARPQALAGPRTGSDGRFSLRLARGSSSRTLRFAYRAHLGDALPVATRTLTLEVHAGIGLSVSPHVASVGSSIAFRGRLRGGPVPRGGKQLVLEARSPGSAWIEFKVVRTDARGRYRASYRFKFAGPADYRFRVRSEPEADYPFAGGSSNVVAVHER